MRNGADEVVYPEKQIGIWAAVRFSSENIFDYVQLTPDYSINEISVPNSWIGKSMLELDIRRKYHINILATKINGILDPLPSAEHTFEESVNILILAQNSDLQKFLRF